MSLPDQYKVLDKLYQLEEMHLKQNRFDIWITPAEIANAFEPHDPHYGDESWVREQIQALWVGRKVLQVPVEPAEVNELKDVELMGFGIHGPAEAKIAVEINDCRGTPDSPWEQVGLYSSDVPLRYRSRMYEVCRALSINFQRFHMTPATGLLRYERRPQIRPAYSIPIANFIAELQADIRAGIIKAEVDGMGVANYQLESSIVVTELHKAIHGVLQALTMLFVDKGKQPHLASFQARSIRLTLCGLYCPQFYQTHTTHVITAGVGSGKSFAFQIGALIHTAYKALLGQKGLQVLLLYPRVVLAANQFQELFKLVDIVATILNVPLKRPLLDAGGQLPEQLQVPEMAKGRLFQSIKKGYQSDYQILISNLDTLANRIAHPEASRGLTRNLDLVVIDEIHLLSGLYGAHACMLLKRLNLMRALWKLREQDPTSQFEELLELSRELKAPYFVAASATISEPRRHTARITGCPRTSIIHLDVRENEEYGWIHHIFLRQRPEVSSMTAVVNATSCLIHNRRDGVFREYYQRLDIDQQSNPISLQDLSNPVQPATLMGRRGVEFIHKTLGFCDSLDGVGRWADLVADNEQTKAVSMGNSPNPARRELPYFVRFQEPLWRVIHHMSFASSPPHWQRVLWTHYGLLCRQCKQGIKRRISRIPTGLTHPQQENVERLWDFNIGHQDSYFSKLGIGHEFFEAEWFNPLAVAAQTDQLVNMDECPFFLCGLCWWWSMDHIGNNHPMPAQGNAPLNGYKRPLQNPNEYYHCLNAIRVRFFTSRTNFDILSSSTINDIFQARANNIFRDRHFPRDADENCCFLIGSPRVEVGIDLARVADGITFRAMRDPASLQQKSGRVGREIMSDSMIVHIVTENTRDHFYFRNPRIALDPDYLQPIPLHENNRIVARNHFFMGIIDFLCQQDSGPPPSRIAQDGERIILINDHIYTPSFQNWDHKVNAVYNFLFGSHPRQSQNIANLARYLQFLGARDEEISNPQEATKLTPQSAPLEYKLGAIDVFHHEFGPNLLLTPLNLFGKTVTLAQLCAYLNPYPGQENIPHFPRHEFFINTYHSYHTPEGDSPSAFRDRGYLWHILTLPLFRRGIPRNKLPGNHPYVWTPNFFEAAGLDIVRIFEDNNGKRRDLGYEPVSLALALLTPGTFTYRYPVGDTGGVKKVPVANFGSQGLTSILPQVEAILLNTSDTEFFNKTVCNDLNPSDLPKDFVGWSQAVPVFTPRQIGLIPANSEPLVTRDGLIADNDSKPFEQGLFALATPPRCFPLHWCRINSFVSEVVPCRFQQRFSIPDKPQLPRLPWPEVFNLFRNVTFDPNLEITDFVWGLDRQFMTRQVDPARLIYRRLEDSNLEPIVLGNHYVAPGLCFHLELNAGSPIELFVDQVWQNVTSGSHQSLLLQVLHGFLATHACNPAPPMAPPWMPPSRPSIFTVRHLKTIILFHLLEKWHPQANSFSGPRGPLVMTLHDLCGCFITGHPNHMDENRFNQVCAWVAAVQNPSDTQARTDTLAKTFENFLQAAIQVTHLAEPFFKENTKEILLNSLGLTLHAAALRLTGAESSDLAYFYKRHDEGDATIYLFDKDNFGNGTTNVILENFFVSPVERTLVSKQKALGASPDPLPSTDFAKCFEDSLQECANSQAAHLAYHDLAGGTNWADLINIAKSERSIAGKLYDFLKIHLGLNSFDQTIPFQACPEFLTHVSHYPYHHSNSLVPSDAFPTFQALESAIGYCLAGCVACVVAPEQNLQGPLAAKETVNKILLDAMYRTLICEAGNFRTALFYPGTGPGRTIAWQDLALTLVTTMGQSTSAAPIAVELGGIPKVASVQITVIPTAMPSGWDPVFRPSWALAPVPTDRVRPRMVM